MEGKKGALKRNKIFVVFILSKQMGILFAHARDETNILCSAPFVSFERAAVGF